MKFAALSLLFMNFALASNPEIITAPVDHLYIPEGFDSNDSVEVVVTGNFPNPCYSRNTVDVSIKDDMIDIAVTAIGPSSTMKATRACPEMIVPFKEVVTLGNLQGGDYKIRVNHDSIYALADSLKVTEASSSAVDDHIYAAIEWVEKKSDEEFILHGWRYSPCYKLDKIEVVSNKKDTLSILPVMKQTSDHCPMKGVPVSYPAKFDFSSLKTSKPLLHVRTLDGKSINSIIELEGQR